jgi:uncharacterized linocin/CFP29 family protein
VIFTGPSRHQIEGLRAARRNALALAEHPNASPVQVAEALVIAERAAVELERWDK